MSNYYEFERIREMRKQIRCGNIRIAVVGLSHNTKEL